jgi:hypothetical protein
MTKVRKSPTILKPTIDEKMMLQFSSAASSSSSAQTIKDLPPTIGKPPSTKHVSPPGTGPDVRQISLTLKKSLYEKIARNAARKNRTIEEHLIKQLTKRYGK